MSITFHNHKHKHTSSTHIVVVFPAPLCPRKDTTWFSWRLRLSLFRASLLPVLYTLVSLSIHTTNGRWLGSSSMPLISSVVTMTNKWNTKDTIKHKNRYYINLHLCQVLPSLLTDFVVTYTIYHLTTNYFCCHNLAFARAVHIESGIISVLQVIMDSRFRNIAKLTTSNE